MVKKKKSKPKMTVQKATKESGSILFADRIGGGKVEIENYVFHYRALPYYVEIYVVQRSRTGKIIDGQRLYAEYVKWGITDITEDGVSVDYEKETASFIDRKFEGLADSTMDSIPGDAVYRLYNLIYPLTHLSDGEKTALDFTSPSEKVPSREDVENVQTGSDEVEQKDPAKG